MTIEFHCSQCLQPLRVPDTSIGKSARCPKCQALTVVPGRGSGIGVQGSGVGGQEQGERQQPVSPPPPAPTPASPASSANDALFAMLKAATTPQPTAPLASAPFADPAPADHVGRVSRPVYGKPDGSGDPSYRPAASANPYASPAEAYAWQAGPAAADRPGLPWEVEGAGVMSWWKTSQMCLTDSSHAFRIMRVEGGIGSPFLFAVLGMMIGFLGQTLWRLPVLLMSANVGNAAARQEALMGGLIEIGLGAIITLVSAALVLPIAAVIYHLALLMLGGARQGFEATYRVVAFTHGSLAWLQVIPCFGGLIVLVMLFVCLINGLAQAHETTTGKAAGAVFIPLGVCFVGGMGLTILIIAAIAANA
jgi:hypothetical protein